MKKRRQNGVGRRVLTAFFIVSALVLTLLAIGVTVAGAWMRKTYSGVFPEELLTRAEGRIAPAYYAYEFSDRADRAVAKEVLLEDWSTAENASYVPYTEFPQALTDAFVAIEDKRFFKHNGVDWLRTARACFNYLLHGDASFGASTITQQLVKNLTGENDRTPGRKIREIFSALELERRMDKTEILEFYLNVIHFADRSDGIGAAAKHYFSKEVVDLTPAECATLAAIVNNPSLYHPIRNPENNLARRNLILSEMRAQGLLPEAEYQSAVASPLGLTVPAEESGNHISSWYQDLVTEDVLSDLCATYGMSRSAASDLLATGGLRIDTAMDPALQKIAEEYYRTLDLPVGSGGTPAQSALILLDSRTGDILAVAGAAGEKKGTRVQNFATQTRRSPGSAVKPITVYAPAFQKGVITWASVYDDTPVRFSTDTGALTWPHNANGVYRGLTGIPYAVAHSTNTVAVGILEDVGRKYAFEMAKNQFHIPLSDAPGKSDCDLAPLALGQLSEGVTLLELTRAYTVFADGGVYHPTRSYYRVTDRNGKILLSNPEAGEIVLSEGNAAVMTELLRGVVDHGTASAVTLDEICACAGKTGTAGGDSDRWFIGYTPDVICGVWCGYEYPEPLCGKNLCLPIFDDVMHKILAIRPGRTEFSKPADLVRCCYCVDSGDLVSAACGYDLRGNRSAVGWFVKGTEPKDTCTRHVLCDYDTENGGVSHGFCPEEVTRKVALVRVERHFPVPVTVGDAQYTCRGDPTALPPNPNPHASYFADAEENPGVSATGTPANRSCPVHTEEAAPEPVTDDGWRSFFRRFAERFPHPVWE